MKKNLCAAAMVFLAGSLGPAVAADLPARKAPPAYLPPPPLMSWTGFYAGLNAGGTWSNNAATPFGAAGLVEDPIWLPATPFGASATGGVSATSGGGFIGGGQVGYNYQLGASFLVGLEADFQGVAGSKGQASAIGLGANPITIPPSTAITATQISKGLDWIGTVRGRLGWLFTPALLLYGTGGFAYGGTSLSIAQFSADDQGFFGPAFGSASLNSTLTGWTAGGGVEWMFLPNWSAKIEYLYYNLGGASAVLGPVNGLNNTIFPPPVSPIGFANVTRVSTSYTGNIVRAGVNYHFNWGSAPVIAAF